MDFEFTEVALDGLGEPAVATVAAGRLVRQMGIHLGVKAAIDDALQKRAVKRSNVFGGLQSLSRASGISGVFAMCLFLLNPWSSKLKPPL
jgi:hypothetical protein